jgi:hypothetical protein
MSKRRAIKFIGEGISVLLMLAVVVANATEGNWAWFGISLAIVCLWLVQLTANVVLDLIGEESGR